MNLNRRLKDLEEENKSIRVGLVGAGLMGTGMVSQISLVSGMKPSLVVDRTTDKILNAFNLAGIKSEDIVVSNKLAEINKALEDGKYVASNRMEMVYDADLIDVVVDATGRPDSGAKIAYNSILNKKHTIMLNVEADSVVGPILNKMAKSAGVVYSGTAGDEPGSAMELYDFAEMSGFEVLAMGKGKNNPINYYVTPDMVEEEAKSKGLKPSMLAGFVDGTNTMIEMNIMANATGFVPDVVGGHGLNATVDQLPEILKLKEDGGILNRYGVVEYVNGIAPGVFVIVTSKLPQVHSQMKFLKMGDGPNYILYRPYHLASLETPVSIAMAALENKATIAPIDGPVCETIAIAKKDLKAGDRLDGIGQYTVYGSLDTYENAKSNSYIPMGLINENAVAKRDIKKDEFITYEMVELDTSTMIYKLRQIQDEVWK